MTTAAWTKASTADAMTWPGRRGPRGTATATDSRTRAAA